MSNIQQPYITWQIKSGDRDVGFNPQRVLIIGVVDGATSGQLIKNADYSTIHQFGNQANQIKQSSLLALALKRFRDFNKQTVVDVLSYPTNVSAQPTGAITVVGDAERDAIINIKLFDDMYSVDVVIAKTDNKSQIVNKIRDAISTYFLSNSRISVEVGEISAFNSNEGYTFTIKPELGMSGNNCIININNTSGSVITSTITSGGVQTFENFNTQEMTSPKLETLLDERYQTIIFDSSTKLPDVREYTDSKFNVNNGVEGGVGISWFNESPLVNVPADGLYTAEVSNSKTIVVFANQDKMRYNAIPLLALAEIGAKRSLRLTEGAVIGDLVLDAEESFGGVNKSSLPYHNTPMSYAVPSGVISQGLAKTYELAGASFLVPSSNFTVMGDIVTTYKKDLSGQTDTTFKYLNAVDTAMAIQEYLYNNCKKEFGQTRATKGSLVAGVSMTNEISVKAFIVSLYEDLVLNALAQGGREAVSSFKDNLTVELDITKGNYEIFAPVAIVSQFRGLQGVVAISFNFKG